MRLRYNLIFAFVMFSFSIFGQYERPFEIYKENGKYGLKDAQKTIVVKSIYQDIKVSQFGVFAVQAENKKWAIFDKEGVRVSDFIFDKMEQQLPNIIEVRQGAKVGLIAENGLELVPTVYDKIAPIGKVFLSQREKNNNSMRPNSFEYRGAIVSKGGKSGFMNNDSKLILPIDYEKIKATANFDLATGFIDVVGLITVKNNQYGIVNEKGELIIPYQYNYINGLNRLGFGELQKNGKRGLYNTSLQVIVAPDFEEITILNEKLFAGLNDNIWSIYHIKNTAEVRTTVEGIYPFANGFSRIKKGEKWSVLSPEGNVLLPYEYQGVVPFGRNVLLEKDGKSFIYTSEGKLKLYEFLEMISWRNLNDEIKPIQSLEGKYGYINDDGTFVIEPIYDAAEEFKKGIAIVKKGGFYGFVDKAGKLVKPIAYQIPNLDRMPDVLLVKKGSKYGYFDYQGKELITCKYEAIAPYFHRFLRAKVNGKWGLISKNEAVLIDFQYDFLESDNQKHDQTISSFRYQKGSEIGWISVNGIRRIEQDIHNWAEKIEPINDSVYSVLVGSYFGLIDKNEQFIIPIRYGNKIVFDEKGRAIVKENGFWGMIDKEGKVIIPTIYNSQFTFDENQMACVSKDGKYGVIDVAGNVIVPTIYDNYIYTNYEYWTVKQGNKSGIVNRKGELLIPIEYEKVFPYINHLALAKKDGKWGYIDESNQAVIPFEYQVLNSFIGNRAIAKKEDYWGMISPENRIVLPFEYDKLLDEVNGVIKANKEGFWGVFNHNYELILPFEFDNIEFFDNYFRIEKEGKVGLYSNDGQLILSAFYDAITIIECGFKIQKDDKVGLLDFDGSVLIPAEYEELMYFHNGMSRVKKGEKYGMISSEGKWIISCAYDYLGIRFTGKYIEAAKDGRYGILNKKGRTVVKFRYEKIRWKMDEAEGLLNGEWIKIDLK